MWRTLLYFYLNINIYCNLTDYLFGIFSNSFWMDFLCVYLFIFWFRFKLIGSATVFVISQYYYYIFLIFFCLVGRLATKIRNEQLTTRSKNIYIFILCICVRISVFWPSVENFRVLLLLLLFCLLYFGIYRMFWGYIKCRLTVDSGWLTFLVVFKWHSHTVHVCVRVTRCKSSWGFEECVCERENKILPLVIATPTQRLSSNWNWSKLRKL